MHALSMCTNFDTSIGVLDSALVPVLAACQFAVLNDSLTPSDLALL